MAIFITFEKRNGYFYQKIGIKAGISPFCMSISICIEFQSFMVSVSVSVSKLQTCIVSVLYRYRLFRPRKYQYRIGIDKSGIEDLCPPPHCPPMVRSESLDRVLIQFDSDAHQLQKTTSTYFFRYGRVKGLVLTFKVSR